MWSPDLPSGIVHIIRHHKTNIIWQYYDVTMVVRFLIFRLMTITPSFGIVLPTDPPVNPEKYFYHLISYLFYLLFALKCWFKMSKYHLSAKYLLNRNRTKKIDSTQEGTRKPKRTSPSSYSPSHVILQSLVTSGKNLW